MYPNSSYGANYQQTGNAGANYPPTSAPATTYSQDGTTTSQTYLQNPSAPVQDQQLSGYSYPYSYGYGQYNQQYAQNYSVLGYQPQAQGQYGYNIPQTGYNQYSGGYAPQYNAPIPTTTAPPQTLPQGYGAPQGAPPSTYPPPTHSAFSSNRKRKRSPDGHTGYRSGHHQSGHYSGHSSQRQGGHHSGGHRPNSHSAVPLRQVRISNIPEKLSNSPSALRKLLSKVGRVMCMNIPHYHDTGKPRNYAFVKFTTPEEAARACSEFSGKNVYGSVIDVVIANKQAEYSGRTHTIQVENLPYDALDSQIREQFSKHGEIVNFKLVKHHKSHRATAIIEYQYGQSVQSALNEYHDEIYVGEAVEAPSADPRNKRRKLEQPDGYDVEDGRGSPHHTQVFDDNVCEVYVGRLPPQLNSNKDELQRIFEPFGDIENINIIYDHATGHPKGIAYIRYRTASAATQAYKHLDQSSYYGRTIVVQPSKRQQQAQSKPKAPSGEIPSENEIYIANLPANLTENDIRNDLCSTYRFDIESVLITEMPPTAFIKFKSNDTASRVVAELNDYTYQNRTLSVRHSLSTDSRAPRMPLPDEKLNNEIHVGNLPYDHCNESTLRDIFSICGEIINIRLPAPHRHSNIPRGFAFVQFADVDSAMRAISLHGKIVDNRAINVSFPNVPPRAQNTKGGSKGKDRSSNRSKSPRDYDTEAKDDTGSTNANESSTSDIKNEEFAMNHQDEDKLDNENATDTNNHEDETNHGYEEDYHHEDS